MLTSPALSPTLRRRSVLAALGLGTLGALPAVRAQTAPGPQRELWRAMSRVGYGPTPALLDTVRRQGARAWALQQVEVARSASQSPPAIPADYAHILLPLPQIFDGQRKERESAKFRREEAGAKETQPQSMERPALDDPTQFSRAMAMGAAAWHLRSCSDPALEPQLLARMTEFWFNHFNVYVGKGAVRPFVGHYLIHAIRAHALGRFEDLVLATAHHPAMLHYLDQWQSVAEGSRGPDGKTRGLNENYARELMELHTLGVHGGYTQADVRALARILTGWTIGPREDNGFRFAPRAHDNGSKTLLGRPYGGDNAGEQEGMDAIRALVRHPSTAQRVCLRLAQCFVSDTPPDALVQRLVQTFTQTQGDIAEVLRTLLQSKEFWAPEHQLFKTPLDFTCSALAATQTGSDTRALLGSYHFLNQAGQPLHGWQTPDGYRFDAATWRVPEGLTRRADFALTLGRASDTRYLLPFLSEASAQTVSQERTALQSGLILASPEFQWK